MDEIADEEIEDYLATGLWQGKAGAFGIQDRPGWLHLKSGSQSTSSACPWNCCETCSPNAALRANRRLAIDR
jgi:hypothetical protein